MTSDDKRFQQAWETLGIEPTTDPDELRAAFRRRSMETHPDRDGSAEQFDGVRSAYSLLLEHALQVENEVERVDDELITPWVLDDDANEVDSRVVGEQGRPRRKGFEELLLDALRREYRDG